MVALDHKPAPVIQGNKIGGANTYVEVNTTTNVITVYVSGVKVQEWS